MEHQTQSRPKFSLAIIQYIDETRQEYPLLPRNPFDKQRVLGLSYIIAMEIHPLCNSSVGARVASIASGSEETKEQAKIQWMQHYILSGLQSFEALLTDSNHGFFCHGDHPGLADCCLLPQVYNAQRWGCDLTNLPVISAITQHCNELNPFIVAHPDQARP